MDSKVTLEYGRESFEQDACIDIYRDKNWETIEDEIARLEDRIQDIKEICDCKCVACCFANSYDNGERLCKLTAMMEKQKRLRALLIKIVLRSRDKNYLKQQK